MYDVHAILRILVFAAFCLAALIAFAGWLVRSRRVSPFGGFGRTLRSVTDPVLRPVETRLVRLGGNPVHAGWWLVVLVAVAGVLLLSLIDWMVRTARWFYAAATSGPGALFAFLVVAAYNVLVIALVAEAFRAGVAQREIDKREIEDVEALERRDQVLLARAVVRNEMGIMTMSVIAVVTLALRAFATGS